MHQGDGSEDNGYDTDGNKINNAGGDKTDYIFDKEGNVLKSAQVLSIGPDLSGMTNLDGSSPNLTMRGFGVKSYLATGAITEDNFISNLFTGGAVAKGVGSFLSSKSASLVLKYSNTLNKGNWWRLGLGKHNGQELMRAAWGAHPKYLNQVPKLLQGFNKWIRNIGGGHMDFPNWKP